MPKITPVPPPGFESLPVDEQIDYVQSLWDRIAASPERVPAPEWHLRIIQERLESYKDNPTAGRPWPDIRNDIEQRLRNR